MRIYVLRHGESAAMQWRMANPDAEVVDATQLPDSSVPLSTFGEEQVEALALYFAALPVSEQPTVGFCSPFARTTQTGQGAGSRLTPPLVLQPDNRLREIDFGIFAELTKKGREAKFPAEWAERRRQGKTNYRTEGGENWHDMADRWIDFQKAQIDTLPQEAVVLVSTHETMVSISQWKWGGRDMLALSKTGVPSASITIYDYDGKTFTVVAEHLLPPSPTGKNLHSMESKEKDV